MQVGSEVHSQCRKCGDVWHRVIALAGGQIAQVECGECGARHRYRPSVRSERSPARRAAARPRTRGAPPPVVEADASRPSRPFQPSDSYQVGDRVLHQSFGEGVVQRVAGPSKVEILFPTGSKTLIHRRGSR